MVSATPVDRPSRKSRRPVLVPIVVVFLIPAVVAGGRTLEKQPTFCASCHESQEYYELWIRSGAAKDHPNCIECHTGPGLAGILDGQIRGLKHLAVHFFGTIRKPFHPCGWISSV